MQTLFGIQSGTEGEVVLLGAPFDHGSVTYPGAALGPQVLRHLSSDLNAKDGILKDGKTREHLFSPERVSDAGDIPFGAAKSRETYLQDLQKVSELITSQGKRLLVIGGDHLVTLPLVQGIIQSHGKIQIVQIDAHTDCAPFDAGDLPTHANFIQFAAKHEEISQIIQVGTRGFIVGDSILPRKIKRSTPERLLLDLVPETPIYLTVDTDGFDPLLMPAVGHPETEGLRLEDFQQILDAIQIAALEKKCPLIGADWTEYNPQFDTKNYLSGRTILKPLSKIIGILEGK